MSHNSVHSSFPSRVRWRDAQGWVLERTMQATDCGVINLPTFALDWPITLMYCWCFYAIGKPQKKAYRNTADPGLEPGPPEWQVYFGVYFFPF